MPRKRKVKGKGRLQNAFDPELKIEDTHQHSLKAEERREEGETGKQSYSPAVIDAMSTHYETWRTEEGSDLGLIDIKKEPHRFITAFLQRVLIPRGGTWQTLSLQTVQARWMKQFGNFIYYRLSPECCNKGDQDIEIWSKALRNHSSVKAVLQEAKRVSGGYASD